MQPIPIPEILDEHRVGSDDREDLTLAEHRSRNKQLSEALADSCVYGRQLWTELDKIRRYLIETVPDPRGDEPTFLSSPSGPDDEQGWNRWANAYSEVTSTLAGIRGDNGYGVQEAAREVNHRRSGLVEARDGRRPERSVVGTPWEQEAVSAAPLDAAAGSPTGHQEHADAPASLPVLRALGLGALIALAVRGILPRR